MEDAIANQLLEKLYEYSLELDTKTPLTQLEPGDLVPARLRYREEQRELLLTYAPEMTASSLASVANALYLNSAALILGPRITERSAEILRGSGINYLDAHGNAYIAFGNVLIDVRGRRARAPYGLLSPKTGSRGGVNLMSPKRAQVVFALLSWEHLLTTSVRSIARAAQVSLGQVQETLDLLTAQGFLTNDRRMAPRMREQLLGQWVQAYPSGLGAKQIRFELSGDPRLPLHSTEEIAISGEAAVDELINHETLTLYCTADPRELIRERRWHRAEQRPNIFVKQKFWESPTRQNDFGVTTAPPLLVYADLLASQDGRQREVAVEFRKQHDQLRAN